MIVNKNWIHSNLTSNDLKEIEQSVKNAELKTSGEIVTMLVHQSGSFSHVKLIVFLILSNLFLLSLNVFSDLLSYFEYLTLMNPFYTYLIPLLGLVLLMALTLIISKLRIINILLTPHHDIQRQVSQRALIEFYTNGLQKTRDQTGILIMVSLYERSAVVLADQGINNILKEGTWDDLIKKLIETTKKQNLKTALVESINKCGEILETHFPIKDDDENELNNQLIVKE